MYNGLGRDSTSTPGDQQMRYHRENSMDHSQYALAGVLRSASLTTTTGSTFSTALGGFLLDRHHRQNPPEPYPKPPKKPMAVGMRTYIQRDCPAESTPEVLASKTPNHKATNPTTSRNTSNLGIHPRSNSRTSFDPSILQTRDSVEFAGGGVSGTCRGSGGDSGRGSIGGGEREGSGG